MIHYESNCMLHSILNLSQVWWNIGALVDPLSSVIGAAASLMATDSGKMERLYWFRIVWLPGMGTDH